MSYFFVVFRIVCPSPRGYKEAKQYSFIFRIFFFSLSERYSLITLLFPTSFYFLIFLSVLVSERIIDYTPLGVISKRNVFISNVASQDVVAGAVLNNLLFHLKTATFFIVFWRGRNENCFTRFNCSSFVFFCVVPHFGVSIGSRRVCAPVRGSYKLAARCLVYSELYIVTVLDFGVGTSRALTRV